MMMMKKQSIIYGVLVIALIVGAYCVVSRMTVASDSSDWMGICVHSLSSDEARTVNASGAGWIRIDASGDFEASVKNAKAFNLSVLGILDSWMFNKSTIFTLEEWRGNVTHYVSQYADYVDAWEIWNEPANPTYPLLDLNVTNQNSKENLGVIVQFYSSMVKIASPIIRQYDPSAKILLFGGLNLYSGENQHLELDKEFARQLVAMNIEQYGNAISVHAYPWMSQVQPRVWDIYSESLAYYRGLFTNKSLEVWVTETGQTTEGNGEDGQAQYMADALGYFQGKVTRLFWYSLLDNAWEENSFGLIGDDGTPRLAYYELQKQLTK
jgi:hypothetical protein